MLWSRIFVLFSESKLTLILSLIAVLQLTEAQITRDQFLLVLSDALEHNWDFETDRIDVEIKRVELEISKRKYSGFKYLFLPSILSSNGNSKPSRFTSK